MVKPVDLRGVEDGRHYRRGRTGRIMKAWRAVEDGERDM